MDRLSFFKRIEKQCPNDAELQYWLAKELAEQGMWVEAISRYSAGLTDCRDDAIRVALLEGLSEASAMLQQGGTSPKVESSNELQGTEQNNGKSIQVDDEHKQVEVNKYEDEGADDTTENASNLVLANAGVVTHNGDIEIAGQVTSSGSNPVHYASSGIGLQVIDGGMTQKTNKPNVEKITFSDVAGLNELKKTIHLRIISPFQNQGLFSKFRKKAGGGVLLYGPPGCGKTFITKATAGECQAAFIPIHITDILDKYIGVSEQNLKDMFDKARGLKPSIMFFDEIDTVGFNRSRSSSNMRGMIDTFLTEMEGIDTSTDQLLVIGATNMPWDVDDALKRPGRFDRLIFVGPPDEEAREHMFRLKLKGRYIENINTHELAKRTEFFSGADIENLCERVAELVLGEILESGVERPMRMKDFDKMLQQVRPSTLEWLHKAKNYVKYANHSGVYNELEEYLRKHSRRI